MFYNFLIFEMKVLSCMFYNSYPRIKSFGSRDILSACKIIISVILILIFWKSRYHWVFQNNLWAFKNATLFIIQRILRLPLRPSQFYGVWLYDSGDTISPESSFPLSAFRKRETNYTRSKLPKEWPLGQPVPCSQGTHWPRGHGLTQGPHPTGIKRNKSCKYYFLIGHSRFCESYILRERRRKTSQCQTSQASESASIPDLWLMWQLKTNHAEGNLDRTSMSFSIHPPYMRRGGRGAGRAGLPPCCRQKLQANCTAWACVTICQSLGETSTLQGALGFSQAK